MSKLSICLFRKFLVRRNAQVVEGFESRKVQELFCYLLLHRDHALPRETLASLLWPDTTTAQVKKSLRQALWQLQSALGSQAEVDDDRVLLVESDRVQLNSEADIWLDVAVFERAFEVIQMMPGEELDLNRVQIMQEAVQLYQGSLLEGWYQDWCVFERERLQNMYLTMLDKLMCSCEARREYETGLLYGMRILCYDRARERTHRQLMRLHYLNSDRAAALRQYEQCAAAMEEELRARPSKGTMALYEQIQSDQLAPSEPAFTHPDLQIAPEVLVPPLQEILCQLTHLQTVLTELQNQVQQNIQALQQCFSSQSASSEARDAHIEAQKTQRRRLDIRHSILSLDALQDTHMV
jgi:DNA-binding SARP family transcriptional activator